MSDTSNQRTDDLIDRIIGLTSNEDLDDVMAALATVMMHWMALKLCPSCRRNFARELKKGIPHMLTEANRMAAHLAQQDERPTGPTCH